MATNADQQKWRPIFYGLHRSCPANYTCVNSGPNPDFGYTNFDNIIWGLILSFQLLTMDFWENVFNKVIDISRKERLVWALGKKSP